MMSKTNEKFTSTFYAQDKKKMPKTPPKVEVGSKRNKVDPKKKIPENQIFQDVTYHEKDERFRYLLKHGDLKKI